MTTSQTSAPHVAPSPGSDPRARRLHRLSEVVQHASHLLPAQGPITVFVHHNTLHAFEHLPFHEAVKQGAHVFGCQPYLTEDVYRDALRRGRIRFSELREVLERDLGARGNDPIPCLGSRLELRLAMLQYPLRTGPTHELIWYVAEENALRRVRREASSPVRAGIIAETRRWVMRDLRTGANPERNGGPHGGSPNGLAGSVRALLERFGESRMEHWSDQDWERFTLQALWRVCCDGVRDLPHYHAPAAPAIRHRDVLLEATGVDADAPVNELMIRFCAAFLDQGFAHWHLPKRDEGFYRAFCALYRRPLGPPARWMKGLERELARLDDAGIGPLEALLESLEILGVVEDEWEGYLRRALRALPGWAGMIRQLEIRGDRVAHPAPAGSLAEYLAIRLVLDRFALAHTARTELGMSPPVGAFWQLARGWIDPNWPPSVEQRAFLVFKVAQLFGLSPDVLHRLPKADWGAIVQEIEAFTSLERRRIFHMAYELRFRRQALDAVALHARDTKGRPRAPGFQLCCCLDEREESFRRHIEEVAPSVETFGAAGFYGVAMYYRGAADAHFVPLCPVVVRPSHWVTEEIVGEAGKVHARRARRRRALGTASHQFHVGSRSFAVGALLSGALGILASIPLVARILFPRLAAKVRQRFGRIVQTPPSSRLQLERTEPTTGPENGHVGYSVDEMSDAGERFLRDIGLTSGFARLLILLGHGSNSLNNPHNSAYNCGACSGSAGGPNARAMAQILNDPRVRARLADRGVTLPRDTVVVGGAHNTCDDSVAYFDVDRIPGSHRDEFDAVRHLIDHAGERNAHERCRRFMSAPLTLSFADARLHVEERSEDLAQTRPELGHATNAITIVGRREWSRGLFLDRRAFLTSYDPTQDDDDCTILTRILSAVFPVCAGISLEYYFSHVDNSGYGAGTKLPHNLAALLGVMDGAASDLRTGLPWQMVEIHEPVRSLFLIETTPESMLRIIERNECIGRLCRNEWVLLAVLHPHTRAVSVYDSGAFHPYLPQASVLPKAFSSADWYRGWRDHLEFAEIGA